MRQTAIKQIGLIALAVTGCIFLNILLLNQNTLSGESQSVLGRREALYYTKIDNETVQCELCPRRCLLFEGMRGFCRVREARGGKLYTLVYGNPAPYHIDPIEKKPVFHLLPATSAFSIATAGCNLRCKFCQNWTISQRPPEEINSICDIPLSVSL